MRSQISYIIVRGEFSTNIIYVVYRKTAQHVL